MSFKVKDRKDAALRLANELKKYKDTDWSKYIFTDETMIRLWDLPLYHCRLPNSYPKAIPCTSKPKNFLMQDLARYFFLQDPARSCIDLTGSLAGPVRSMQDLARKNLLQDLV